MTTALDNCHDCAVGDVTSLERSRFFPRQLVSAADLTQDQIYFREKLRRHNRLLHGWGIVCGVLVKRVEGCTVKVSQGYILGPYGDEILVAEDVTLDVCTQSSVIALDCGDIDPWCEEAPRMKEDQTAYLAIRYIERDMRPVSVPGCGCGCDDRACEYSRVRDGFELAVLTELPDTYKAMRTQTGKASLDAAVSCKAGRRGDCPDCPSDPWIILADLKVSAGVVHVDCDPHRRYVASFASYWFACPSPVIPDTTPPIVPETVCHRVYGFQWEGLSAMPPALLDALQRGDLVEAVQLGLHDLGTVQFTSSESDNPNSHLVSPLPFDAPLSRIFVYQGADDTSEPAAAQAARIADLIVTTVGRVTPTKIVPQTLPSGVGCPLVTVLTLGYEEGG